MKNKATYLCAGLLLITACATNTSSSQKQRAINTLSPTQLESQFLVAINRARSSPRMCGNKKFPAARALILNSKLTSASYKHSQDMSKNQFLEHISSNGDTLVERMKAVGYAWSAVGENLAHNQKNIQQVIEDWLSSPGHCSNLMSSDYTQAGVAVVNWYWAQVYAAPK